MNLRDAAYNLVHDYPGGASSLAPRLGKNSTYLSAEVGHKGTAKLGLLDACKLTNLTGDLRILNAFAAESSCMVIPLPTVDSGCNTFEQMAKTAKKFGEFFSSAVDAVSDSQVTANELAHVDRELAEMIVVAQALRTALSKVHESSKPKHLKAAA